VQAQNETWNAVSAARLCDFKENAKMNEKWCEHIRKPNEEWYFRRNEDSVIVMVGDEWTFCPICGAKRPEKKGPEVYQLYWDGKGKFHLAHIDQPIDASFIPLRVNKDGYFEAVNP
jgi:hypothetical protein